MTDACCSSVFTLALAGSPRVMVGSVEGLWMVKLARVPSLSSSLCAWKCQTQLTINSAYIFKSVSNYSSKHYVIRDKRNPRKHLRAALDMHPIITTLCKVVWRLDTGEWLVGHQQQVWHEIKSTMHKRPTNSALPCWWQCFKHVITRHLGTAHVHETNSLFSNQSACIQV